jgi:hypothetical protein
MSKRKRHSNSDSSDSSDSSGDESKRTTTKKVKEPKQVETDNTNGDLILHPMFEYLEKWKNDRANWKFNTNKQVKF